MKSSCCHSNLHYRENHQSVCVNQNCKNYLGDIDFLYTPRTWNNIFAFFLFIFIFLFTFNDYSFDKNPVKNSADALLKLHQSKPLTEESLKEELKEQDVVCRDQVFAQIQIESGHMTSYLFQRTNNFLGMRFPFKRPTHACGIFLPESDTIIIGTQKELKKYSGQNHYAVYACWQDCVKDYKAWQSEYFKITEKYLSFLGNVYAEDPAYIVKIKSMSK
jgi:hypothetical protein